MGKKKKNILFFAAAVLLIIFLGNLGKEGITSRIVSGIVIPVQKGLNHLGFDFHRDDSLSQEELRTENELLKSRIRELEKENFTYEKRQKELERLRSLYQLDESLEQYPMTAARVIGKGESNWFSTFLIDKGSRDGIRKNMNVLCQDGLVGYVSYTGSSYSRVTAIIDESSGVSGEFLHSDVLCMVNGNLQQMQSGTLPVVNIDSEAEAEEGDTIVTSGISSKYLPGLKIGTAGKINMDDAGLSKVSSVTPAADFRNIHEVLIITTLKEEPEGSE